MTQSMILPKNISSEEDKTFNDLCDCHHNLLEFYKINIRSSLNGYIDRYKSLGVTGYKYINSELVKMLRESPVKEHKC